MSDALCIIDNAQVAQLVEQRTENPRVGGSNPPLGTISAKTVFFPFKF
jgi:hypothetical protein